VQYHFFCEDKLFAIRVFRTETLEHHSAWIFDGGVRTILTTAAPVRQAACEHLDVSSDALRMEAQDVGGRISLRGSSSVDVLQLEFTVGRTLRWSDTLEEVIHQPDLRCEVHYHGRRYAGVGYCKRYAWAEPPHYWGYRFLQGFLDDRRTSIWTADAVFGTNKYDYFKVLAPDGSLVELAGDSTAHKQNIMFGYASGIRHEARFEELGEWNQVLKSGGMDSHLRQRYGVVTYFDGHSTRKGVAISEYCFGTLG
jgi:hypothetical protein